ncbi:MAG: hypothetical protein ABW252_14675 [Polyangiales bacterium]
MHRCLHVPTSLVVAAGLLAACGRVGFELTSLDVGPDNDGSLPMEFDGAVPDDAGIDEEDAGPPPPCGGLCRNEHGSTECRDEQCVPDCANDYLDCDGNPVNGCETSVSDQLSSCGSCVVACVNPGGMTGCDAGTCAPVCDTQRDDCDEDPVNGCETSLATSVDHCGGCDLGCTNQHGTTSCASGTCEPVCMGGYRDCDGNLRNGCETNANTDPTNCGGCGVTCGVRQTCVANACQTTPCMVGTGDCDANPAVCETNTTNNASHCGFCGNACTLANANAQCAASTCGIASCRAGFGNCDGQAANGCETNTNVSVPNCGGCGMACTNANGTVACTAGACVPTCRTGFGNCDGNPRNGCETALNTLTHCGGCGTACSTAVPNATADCSTGACVARCNDLSGVWALRVRIATTWPSDGFISSGSGSHDFISRVVFTQSGTTLTGTLTPCGREVPPFDNSVTADRYDVVYPTTLFDRTFPGSPLTVTLSGQGVGATFTGARAADPLGIVLANPVTDAWPGLAAARTAGGGAGDQDGDGDQGVTITYPSGGGFSNPQTSGSVFAARASRGSLTTRVRYRLSGTLASCTQSTGNANAEGIDTHTVGCRLTDNSQCDAGEYGHLDSNAPKYAVSSSSYTLVRVAAAGTSVSCATIRASIP